MATNEDRRKTGKRRRLIFARSWAWALVPLLVTLSFGYLLYRSCGVSGTVEDSPATEEAAGPVLEEEGEAAGAAPELEGKGPAVREFKLFFGNSDFNTRIAGCDDVFPVYRRAAVGDDIAVRALRDLLKGPGPTEEGQGYYTSLNPGVELRGLEREGVTAYADFSSKLEDGVAGSCRTMAIRAQITETLLQFEEIERVVILVEGNPGSVLQP